ncbi:MAG: hypothetical protein H6Q61_1046 [Firmicutes bacterium]|nr:hypothetical protein [Bacillota bacterium]
MLLRNGDYLPDGAGGFQTALGEEELLDRVLFRLTARRGAFPLIPALGSKFYRLDKEKSGRREAMARQFAQEALEGEDGLEVLSVSLEEKRGWLTIHLLWEGEPLTVTWKG